MAKIFISYRRSDSEGYAGRLYDHLKKVMTEDLLYLDVKSNGPGQDFIDRIEDAITACDVMLVIIGDQWLNARNEHQQRRIHEPNDRVRQEIASALRHHKYMIPVLVKGARMPKETELPTDIAAICRLQAANISHDNFEYDVERLVASIRSGVGEAFLSDREFESHLSIFFDLAGYHISKDDNTDGYAAGFCVEEMRFGSTRRILILAQSSKAALTKSEVTNLYAKFVNQYNDATIDEIAIVTLGGIDESAERFIRATRELSHIQYTDLQNSVLDFRAYVAAVIKQYIEDGLSSYYVSVHTDGRGQEERTNLEFEVKRWIEADDKRPVAVLGGYGSGKTTFARRLAHVLATQYLEDSTRRIPILLRLGEISGEQSLEGLLGKHFTTKSIVRNYSFDIFMSLNFSGRFVIILDGFDEMKHGMTWDEL